MNLNEAIKQYNKAQEESRAAHKALEAAREAQEAARQKCRNEYTSLFNKETRENYLNSESHKAYEAAQAVTEEAGKKFNTAAAISNAAGSNVLHVVGNILRAAIAADPEKFSKPTHYKTFINAVKDVTGDRFYIDNSYTHSLYLCYLDMPHGQNNAFICNKSGEFIDIDPEKLAQDAPEFTLKEIKKEARQAEKDAEKLRKAAANLEKLASETRAKYNTAIQYYLPSYSSNNFRDSKYF